MPHFTLLCGVVEDKARTGLFLRSLWTLYLREHIPESIAHGITGSECSLGLSRRMWIPQAEVNHHLMNNKSACLLGLRFMELLILFLITIAVLVITVMVGLRLPKK